MSDTDKAAVEAFRRDVVEPSRTSLVIVDFWAEWCGPCKQLTPVIEKACADYAAKGVKLVKINVDENKFIAAQFRVQSIPTVYAVFQGQPVADLSQARTEGQLKAYFDQLLSQLPIESDEKAQLQEIAPLIAMGEELLAGGEHERALSVFEQIAEIALEYKTGARSLRGIFEELMTPILYEVTDRPDIGRVEVASLFNEPVYIGKGVPASPATTPPA
jgi:putative thioredoxin